MGLEERYGKFTILKLKLSRLSYTAVEYFPFSIVISMYVPTPGPQTGRYITKIAAGGNQGNRTRNLQVLSEIY